MSVRISIVQRDSAVAEHSIRFDVDRSTVLGNPFKLRANASNAARVECLKLYRKWLWERIQERDQAIIAQLSKIKRAALMAPVELACHCAPKLCHASVIKNAVLWAIAKSEEVARRKQTVNRKVNA
jgi:hypothetical protein